jgi:hypothetical protein
LLHFSKHLSFQFFFGGLLVSKKNIPNHATVYLLNTFDDAPPSSLMDSTKNPKVKTMEGKRVGVRSLICNTSGVEGRARALGWD